MKKIYISSTYEDLAEFRNVASEALRKIRYDVIRMEDYVARPKRTRAACEADVSSCDIYVGVFAWRYGYIPPDDNDDRRSITELEYRRAVQDKPCLLFLMREGTQMATKDEGEAGERVQALRDELAEYCAAYFSTPDELAKEIIAAVHQYEASRRVEVLSAAEELKTPLTLDPSYLHFIFSNIIKGQDAEIAEISLGPTPWWTTRLHLLAALAADFTSIRQFLMTAADGAYVTMASPLETRRALTRRYPSFERAYLASRADAPLGEDGIAQIVQQYPDRFREAAGVEADVKQDITPMLLRELGVKTSASVVESRTAQGTRLQLEILRTQEPFVVIVADGKVDRVFDRVQMASAIALQAAQESAA